MWLHHLLSLLCSVFLLHSLPSAGFIVSASPWFQLTPWLRVESTLALTLWVLRSREHHSLIQSLGSNYKGKPGLTQPMLWFPFDQLFTLGLTMAAWSFIMKGRLPMCVSRTVWVRREVKHGWEIDESTPLHHHTCARPTFHRDAHEHQHMFI